MQVTCPFKLSRRILPLMRKAGIKEVNLDGAFKQNPPTPVHSMNDFPALWPTDVAVFWDYENLRIPRWCTATTACEGIRNKAASYGRIVEKRLYYDSRQPSESKAPRTELDLSGFTLVDCPQRNRKETLDKKLIVDALCFACDRASLGIKACVVLITSDGDFSYALARLRDMGVFTVIIYQPDKVAKILIDNANVAMPWELDVLVGPSQSQDDDKKELEIITTSVDIKTSKQQVSSSHASTDEETSNHLTDEIVEKLNLQTVGKFALFCSGILDDAEHDSVKEGMHVYSSWVEECHTARAFYSKVGEKDRKSYTDIRTLATQNCFIERGRRNLTAPGKPVVKVEEGDRERSKNSSSSYVRLTHSGLLAVNSNLTGAFS